MAIAGPEVEPVGSRRQQRGLSQVELPLALGKRAAFARRAPGQPHHPAAAFLEVVDAHAHRLPLAQRDTRSCESRAGFLPVLDDELVVEPDAETVVAFHADLVLAIFGRDDLA